MSRSTPSFAAAATVALTLMFTGSLLAQTAPLPVAPPSAQGVSPAGLARLSAILRRDVETGRYAGAVALVARNGRMVQFDAVGSRDLASRLPMEKDTIVRIYSMSKIITSVAVLMLMEEGRFNLDDPVSRYVPELSHPRVLVGGTADAPVLDDARQPITIRHLLTHTAGYVYEYEGLSEGALGQIYQRAKLFDSSDLKEFVSRAATLPLRHQPGTEFAYGINTDILGYLVQVVSGERLGRFLEERIFAPLQMKDTAFDVPAEKTNRLARVHKRDKEGRLAVTDEVLSAAWAEPGRGMESGGGGLFSTAGDYARFAQMLLNGGTLDGRRLLSRKTVELMTANHLATLAKPRHAYSPVMGFGLGVEVRVDMGGSDALGSVGQFGWDGAATTYVRMDPVEKLVAILLVQHFPIDEGGIFTRFNNACYAALE